MHPALNHLGGQVVQGATQCGSPENEGGWVDTLTYMALWHEHPTPAQCCQTGAHLHPHFDEMDGGECVRSHTSHHASPTTTPEPLGKSLIPATLSGQSGELWRPVWALKQELISENKAAMQCSL